MEIERTKDRQQQSLSTYTTKYHLFTDVYGDMLS